jgi:lysylphosphatidylglycerol synthetase-like protein (DUF2156 family)
MIDSNKVKQKLLLSLNYGVRSAVGGLVLSYIVSWNFSTPWFSFIPVYYPIAIALGLTAISYFVFFRGSEARWKSTWIYAIINLITLLLVFALFRFIHTSMK